MSLQTIVEYWKKTDLTGDEIINLIQKPPILYSDLAKYKSIDEVLGEEKYAVVLYQTSSKTSGHYISLSYNDNTGVYRYMDSYALSPDRELQYTPYDQALPTYLIDMLSKVKYEVNTFDYQSLHKGVSTCGRYASVFCLLRNFTLTEINELLTKNKDAYINVPDNAICLLTLVALKDIRRYKSK